MTQPRRALEEMALLKQHLSEPLYQRYMNYFQEDQSRKGSGPVIVNDGGNVDGRAFCERQRTVLEMAECFYIDPDMMPLVEWASHGLDGTDRFAHDLWPSDYGFCWFAAPLVTAEMWGRTVLEKAFTWQRFYDRDAERGGCLLVFYTDPGDDRDEVNAEVKADWGKRWGERIAAIGHLEVNHVGVVWDDERVGPPTLVPPENYLARVDLPSSYGNRQMAESAPNGNRFLLALLMMLNQTVVAKTREPSDRQTAKRMRRMKLPSDVTVVKLRRIAGASRAEGESVVEWAHRWVVRGHWRNQPTRDGIKRIWIAPYVKGPDDKPLKVTSKVNALVR